jgi:hypothetical protein
MADKKLSGKESWLNLEDDAPDDEAVEVAPQAEEKKPSPGKGVVYKRLPSGKLVPE